MEPRTSDLISARRRSTPATVIAAVIAALSVALLSPVLSATPDDAAREAAKAKLSEGVELMKKNEPAAALARFQEAYAMVSSAKIFFNLGLAHQALGHKVDALEAYERFVQEVMDPNPASLAKANREIAVLRPDVARVTVRCDVAGAAVRVDGVAAGTTPLPRPLYLAPGEHALSATLGQRTASRKLVVKGGEDQTVAIGPGTVAGPVAILRPQQAAAPPSPAPAPAAPASTLATAPAAVSTPPPAPAPAPPPPSSGATLEPVGISSRAGQGADAEVPLYRRAWFWGAVAGGAVAVGVVTALLVGGSPSYPTASMGSIPAN